jgi:hypothetical protein
MITRLHTSPEEEDFFIEQFISEIFTSGETVSYRKLPGEGRPDFEVVGANRRMIVEVKRVIDAARAKETGSWSKNVKNLRMAIEANALSSKLKGSYLVRTPFRFPERPPQDISPIAERILASAIANKSEVEIFGVSCELNHLSTDGRGIFFSGMGMGWVNLGESSARDLPRLLKNANTQLGANDPQHSERIVLLANVEGADVSLDDVIGSIARDLEAIRKLDNIDAAYLLTWTQEKNQVTKVFTREFLDNLVTATFDLSNKCQLELLRSWFSPLASVSLPETNEQLFAILRALPNNEPVETYLPSTRARMNAVELGKWLMGAERVDDTKWLIDRFIDDSDPSDSQSALNNDELHAQILKGADPGQVTTVLGNLAWIVQLLAGRKAHVRDAWGYTKKLLAHPNLYIKQQGTIPLIEVTHRRDALKEHSEAEYGDFRRTVFDFLRQNSQFHGIAEWLVKVFYYFRDLNTSEAIEVLERLKNEEDSGALYFYFGIFRSRHFKEVPYDGALVEKLLYEEIAGTTDRAARIRKEIAYHLFHLAKETPNEALALKRLVESLINYSSLTEIDTFIDGMVEAVSSVESAIASEWACKLIEHTEQRWNEISPKPQGFFVFDPSECLIVLARFSPATFLEMVSRLIGMQTAGLYVMPLHGKQFEQTVSMITDATIRDRALQLRAAAL